MWHSGFKSPRRFYRLLSFFTSVHIHKENCVHYSKDDTAHVGALIPRLYRGMSSVLNLVEWVVAATRTSLCGGLLCWSLRGGILAITILVFWRRKEHCLDKSGAEEEWICPVWQTVNASKWKRENSDSSQHTFKPTTFRLPLSWLSAVSDLSLTLYPKPNLTQPQHLCNHLRKNWRLQWDQC